MRAKRLSTLLLVAAGVCWLAAPAWANHDLRQGLGDLFGPLAWGLYVILPMPFLIVGIIAFRLWRSARKQKTREATEGEWPWPQSRLN